MHTHTHTHTPTRNHTHTRHHHHHRLCTRPDPFATDARRLRAGGAAITAVAVVTLTVAAFATDLLYGAVVLAAVVVGPAVARRTHRDGLPPVEGLFALAGLIPASMVVAVRIAETGNPWLPFATVALVAGLGLHGVGRLVDRPGGPGRRAVH